jgi:hypothetical protein
MVLILELISKLNSAGVEYVIVSGAAASIHGSPLLTDDLDVCCRMTEANMRRLIAAIGPLNPVWFDPRRVPLPRDPAELAKFRTMLLLTDLGRFDVLKEVEPIGHYDAVLAESQAVHVGGTPTRVLSIDALIRAKSFAGRSKDKVGVMHLEAVKKRKSTASAPPAPPPPQPL